MLWNPWVLIWLTEIGHNDLKLLTLATRAQSSRRLGSESSHLHPKLNLHWGNYWEKVTVLLLEYPRISQGDVDAWHIYLLYSWAKTLSSGEATAFSVISSRLCPWLQRNQRDFKSRAPSSWWTRGIKLIIKQAADKADALSSQKQIQIGLLILLTCRKVSGAEILVLLKLGKFCYSLGLVSFTTLLFHPSVLFRFFAASQFSVQLWAFYPVGKLSAARRLWKRELLFSLSACRLLQNQACLLSLSTTLEE